FSVSSTSDYFPRLLLANGTLFALFRMVQIAVERLEKMRVAAEVANGQPFFQEKSNVVATFLDLPTRHFDEEQGDFYSSFLRLMRSLFLGNLEADLFEERVRFMFGTNA